MVAFLQVVRLDRNDSELDLSVEMDSQDLISVLKSEEMITKDISIKEHSYGNWAADDLEDELDKAYESGKMTSAQKKRFEKIVEKFTDAVLDYDE